MEEISVIDLFTKILEKLNDLCTRVDKLEKKVGNINKVPLPQREHSNLTKNQKPRDIKQEIEQMRAKHMSKLPAVPGRR